MRRRPQRFPLQNWLPTPAGFEPATLSLEATHYKTLSAASGVACESVLKFSFLAVGLAANLWPGTWRNQGTRPPPWSDGGLAAPV